jgi:hypothetical protein
MWLVPARREPVAIDTQSSNNELANILEGADAIAEFLFGASSSRRKVYYLAECSTLPIFRVGSVLCAQICAARIYRRAKKNA